MSHRRKRRGACVAVAALAGLVAPLRRLERRRARRRPGLARVVVRSVARRIGEAIAAVAPGGTIRIHKGRYREALLIEKPVLIAAGKGRADDRRPLPDPERGDVRWRRHAEGAEDQGRGEVRDVDFNGAPSGRAKDLRLRNTSETAYGINVFATGAIQVANNRATGFTDAGIYVGGHHEHPRRALCVGDNDTFGNNRGIIVEDSAGGDSPCSRTRSTTTTSRHRRAGRDPLHASDGVRIRPTASAQTAPSASSSPRTPTTTSSATTRSPTTRRTSSTRASATAARATRSRRAARWPPAVKPAFAPQPA